MTAIWFCEEELCETEWKYAGNGRSSVDLSGVGGQSEWILKLYRPRDVLESIVLVNLRFIHMLVFSCWRKLCCNESRYMANN